MISLHLGIYDIRVHSVTCTYDMYVYKKRKEIYLIETVKQSKRLGTFRDLPFRKETNRNDRKVSEREITERHVKKTKYRKRKMNERRIRKENNVRNQTKTEKHQTETNKKCGGRKKIRDHKKWYCNTQCRTCNSLEEPPPAPGGGYENQN